MSIEQVFALITIILTTVNAFITYFNISQSRKKFFQDKLFELKLEAYTALNRSCYQSIKSLDINSTPFVQIYEVKDKSEWTKYCENTMGTLINQGFKLEGLVYEYAMLLPSDIITKYRDFANQCIAFVTMAYHFDAELIISNQDKLWEAYVDLLNEYRLDLNFDAIDEGLRKRTS